MKVIYIRRVDDDLYYRLKAIMGELRVDDWRGLLRKLVEVYEEWKQLKQLE